MKRILPLLFLIALPTLAATPVVSPARELVLPTTTVQAPSTTPEIETATDGRNILAVWDDVVFVNPRVPYVSSTLYAAVVTADDTVTPPARTLLGSGRYPDATWTGDEYLVVYLERGRGIFMRRLDASGRVVDNGPIAILTTVNVREDGPPVINWIGTRALITFESGEATYAAAVGAHGEILTPAHAITPPIFVDPVFPDPSIAVDAAPTVGGVHVLNMLPNESLRILRTGSDGTVLSGDDIAESPRFLGRPRIASDGIQSLVIWNDGLAVWAQRVNPDGTRRGQPIRVAGSTINVQTLSVSATISGFVIVGDDLRAVRIDVNGNLLDAGTRDLGEPGVFERVASAISTSDGRVNIVYNREAVVTLRRYSASLQSISDAIGVSRSAPPQTSPAIAATSDGFLAVWRDGDTIVAAPLNAHGTVTRPVHVVGRVTGALPGGIRLTRAGSRFIATWIEQSENSFVSRIVALNGDGLPLGAPVTLESSQCGTEPAAVASQGNTLLAVWHTCTGRELYSQRFTLAAEPVGTRTLLAKLQDVPTELELIAAGDGFYAAWFEQPSAYNRLMGMRLDATGQRVSAQELLPLEALVSTFELATNGRDVFVAWLSHNTNIVNDFISAFTIAPDDEVTESAIVTEGGNRKELLDARWDGTNYAVTWLAGDAFHLIRVSEQAQLLTPLPHTPMFTIELSETPQVYAYSGGVHTFLSARTIDRDDVGRVPRVVAVTAFTAKRRAVTR
ncbi:MAG TPA: hypothetical protein VF618_23755 [Thermoanaerobaculia bacterium]